MAIRMQRLGKPQNLERFGLLLLLLLAGCLAGCGRTAPHARSAEAIRVALEPGSFFCDGECR